jgi:hypothetical protein
MRIPKTATRLHPTTPTEFSASPTPWPLEPPHFARWIILKSNRRLPMEHFENLPLFPFSMEFDFDVLGMIASSPPDVRLHDDIHSYFCRRGSGTGS